MTTRSLPDSAQIPFRHSLSARLLAAFAIITLLSVGGLAFLAIGNERRTLENQLSSQLTSVADLKSEQIRIWLAERQGDIRLLAVNALNQDHFAALFDSNLPEKTRVEFAAFLTDNLVGLQQSRPGYAEIVIVDVNGVVQIATNPRLIGRRTDREAAYLGALEDASGEYIGDIVADPRLGLNVMHFGHIMTDVHVSGQQAGPEIIGVVITTLDMAETIYPLIEDWPGLGQSGETLLVRATDDGTEYLNNLRFDADAALRLSAPLDADHSSITHKAARGGSGTGRMTDYRGKDVLATYRFIDEVGWGFVAKKDIEEAFAPLTALAQRTIMLVGWVLVGVSVISILLSRTLTQPLAKLVQATRQVADGDLATRIEISRADEIGALAESIRHMVTSLDVRQRQSETASYVLHSLNATPDVLESFPAVASDLRFVCGCQEVCFGLLDEQRTSLQIMSYAPELGSYHALATLPLSEAAFAESIMARRSHYLSDLEQARERPYEKQLFAMGFRSRMIFPLLAGDRLLGVLGLAWHERDGFNPEHLPLIEQVTNAVALAQERGRLFEETRRRAEELETVNMLTQALRGATTIDDIVSVVQRRVAGAVDAQLVTIYLLERGNGELVMRGSYPLDTTLPVARVPLGEGITGRVAVTGESYWTDNLSADPVTLLKPGRDLPELVNASLSIPLRAEMKIVGVLHIAWTVPHRRSPNEARLLSTLAEIAGNALHRAEIMATLEQRVAERTSALAEANERLTELDRLKSKFVSDVSHELRAPVHNLGLYLSLLERSKEAKRAHYQAILRKQTDRLKQLIEDILDMSRLETSLGEVTMEPVALNDLVRQVVATHEPQAEAKGLVLSFDAADKLSLIAGERNQLIQVVTNLVTNAINYTLEGFVAVRTLNCVAGDGVCLEVEDSGMGIDADDLPHLFDRFYRGTKTREMGINGTGLGLGIVREIIHAHGGRVEVDSEPGVGSTFRVILPLPATAAGSPERNGALATPAGD